MLVSPSKKLVWTRSHRRYYIHDVPMPLEIVGLGREQVRFVWSETEEDVWGARDLRMRCTCALCKSEVTGERILDVAKIPEQISVTHMDLVGNYGVNIHFS